MRRWFSALLVGMLALTLAGAVEYHVNNGIACSDANAGTDPNAPLCTVQAGLNKWTVSGNIVTVHAGTYPECASYVGATNGTAGSPMTLRGDPNTDPNTIIIDASGVAEASCPDLAFNYCHNTDFGYRAALTIKRPDGSGSGFFRIRDLSVVPTAFDEDADPGSLIGCTNATCIGAGTCLGCMHNDGIDLECVNDVEILNVHSNTHPTFTTTASGDNSADSIIHLHKVNRVLIKGSDFSNGGSIVAGFNAFSASSGSTEYWITESHVRDFAGGFVNQSGGNKQMTITFNDIHHMNDGADGNNSIMAYNLDNLRIAYNRMYDHSDSVTSIRAFSFSTGFPRVIVNNNYFKARAGGQTGVLIGYSSDPNQIKQVIVRNNLFEGYSKGIELQNKKIFNCDLRENNNGYYSVTTPISDSDTACTYTLSGSSLSFSSPDPLDANDCPASGTVNIVNVGDANYPTPTCGSGRPDMGACEFGCSGPWGIGAAYAFSPSWSTSDTTPDLDWSGSPGAGVIEAPTQDFVENLKGATQTTYRCQIDSSYTFNSAGISLPLWDSGTVTSAATSCTSGVTLTAGVTYWARIQLGESGRTGIWSMPFSFTETPTGTTVFHVGAGKNGIGNSTGMSGIQ